jgi:hypothetical protein
MSCAKPQVTIVGLMEKEMGQEPSRAAPPCEKEKAEWQTAQKKYADARVEFERLTQGNVGGRAGPVSTFALQVDRLKTEMDGAEKRYIACKARVQG